MPLRRASFDLRDKVVLLTGGGRGIGAATAGELARRGAKPVLVDVDEVALAATAARVGGDVLTAVADVTDAAAMDAAVAKAIDRHRRLDVVWANAGIGIGGPVEIMEPDAFRRVIEVNLLGAYTTVRAALPHVIEARGHVAVTASLASFAHAPGLAAYAASKAGVEAFADALRIEVAHQGVTVASLHPSWIDTDMVRDGDNENAAFAVLRSSMRWPLSKTFPVETVVPSIVDSFEQRRTRVFLPGFVGLAYLVRNVANSPLALRDQVQAAPEMRRLFVEQAKQQGARLASFGSRWSPDGR